MAIYEMTVSVRTQYLEEQSEPDRSHYVFAYAITIKNTGNIPAQLISRHWVITDANDRVQEVRGLGVVGNQPLLQPGAGKTRQGRLWVYVRDDRPAANFAPPAAWFRYSPNRKGEQQLQKAA